MLQRNVVVVGGIPEPIGGVTNFIYRLAMRYNTSIFAIIDLYDTGNKVELTDYDGEYHLVSEKFSRVAYLRRLLHGYREKTIFWNFSRPYSFLLLLLMPKYSKSRWVLMLHHGSLEINGYFKRIITNYAIACVKRKIDLVLALNDHQECFYYQHGFKAIERTCSYLPCLSVINKIPYLQTIIDWLRLNNKSILVASGFPRKMYNHMWLIDFARDNNVAVFLFLYGDGDVMPSLIKACQKSDDCYLFYGCTEHSFNFVLAHADIYVRPNDIDSFGISCADAITLGTRVLASDVCPRFPGCRIYDHREGGYQAFSDALLNMLADRKIHKIYDITRDNMFNIELITGGGAM